MIRPIRTALVAALAALPCVLPAPGAAAACAAPGLPADAVAPPSRVASDSAAVPGPPVGFLWVTRGSLARPAAVEELVERARAMRVRTLLVQVIGRGDAWYVSDRLPRAEPLDGAPAGWDPLAEVLARAHAADIAVHAWINCALVWSAPGLPRDPRHVARAHPEWFACLPGGRSTLALTPEQRAERGLEGAWLSPAHAGVRAWVAANAAELARRYPVDGIHLDYIRQPAIAVGYDGATRVGFALESGVDRLGVQPASPAARRSLDSAFTAFQARQVTAMVAAVRESLDAVRPGLPLSAAVRPDPREARRDCAQDWPAWLDSGLVDRAFPMCYSPVTQTVLDQLVALAGRLGTGRIVPGIAVYNATPTRVVSNLKGAQALGYPALALYSYDALFEHPGTWERLSRLLVEAGDPHP